MDDIWAGAKSLFCSFSICSCPLCVWSRQDLPSGACLGLLLSVHSIHQLGCCNLPTPCTFHLPHFVCPAHESLDLGVDDLLQKIAIAIPRGISRPSQLLDPCCLQICTRPGISRIVAFYPASLSLQAQKPSTTGTTGTPAIQSFSSSIWPHQRLSLSLISLLPLCSSAPALPFRATVFCFVCQRSCFAVPGKRACLRQVPVLLVPGESMFLLKMLLRPRSSLSLLQSLRSLKCGRISGRV